MAPTPKLVPTNYLKNIAFGDDTQDTLYTMIDRSIKVTKTLLPPREIYNSYLDRVWASRWVTNMGPLSLELENNLRTHLGVDHLSFVANGTLALQIAIRALELTGEVITTPFSYVATTAALAWEGCTPVFVDIDPETFNLDPLKIESAITSKTSAILATHVYGIPCDVEAIDRLARKYKLKVIYDAAHCFGVDFNGHSLLTYGDCSTLSFHATKLFHTGEGGAVICKDPKVQEKVNHLRNFGHDGPEAFFGIGINAKNSELHAAMGLAVMPLVAAEIGQRKRIFEWYDKVLFPEMSPFIRRPVMPIGTVYNFSYYPIFFSSELRLLAAKKMLEANDIYPRRYFYPSLATLNYVKEASVPIALDCAKTALCLPMFSDLQEQDATRIAKLIYQSQIDMGPQGAV